MFSTACRSNSILCLCSKNAVIFMGNTMDNLMSVTCEHNELLPVSSRPGELLPSDAGVSLLFILLAYA